MDALRRILKYTPAVMLGLLVVAWVVSLFTQVELQLDYGDRNAARLAIDSGTFRVCPGFGRSHLSYGQLEHDWGWPLGDLYFDSIGDSFGYWFVPVPLLISSILPLAMGPFLSFRFRLWHYLAYTALVAVELAYYLRWQT